MITIPSVTTLVSWAGRPLLVSIFMLLSLLSAGTGISASAAPPSLHAMAAVNPDRLVRVMAQDNGSSARLTAIVESLGGRVVTDLSIINAVSAEMEAGAAVDLAYAAGVRWVALDAPVISASSTTTYVRDEFNSSDYNNNDGPTHWTGPWQETGDSSGAGGGDITVEVDDCPDDNSRCIEFDADTGDGATVTRGINLGQSTSATLTFDYHLDSDSPVYTLDISNDGGQSWTTLRSYEDEALVIGESVSLNNFLSANTRIRFRLADEGSGHLYIDNVQVTYDTGSNAAGGHHTVGDNFQTASYNNNDGSALWSGPWQEAGDGGGATGGDINVEVDDCPDDDSRCIEFDADADEDASVTRGVDLSQATAATLTFDYHHDDNDAEYVLEVSANGGQSWTTVREFEDEELIVGASVDLTPFISGDTRIRFRLDKDGDGHLYIDNVQITFNGEGNNGGGNNGGGNPTAIARDTFAATSYSGSDGSHAWVNDWLEIGDNDSASGGDITVEYDDCPVRTERCVEFDADAGEGAALMRAVDLSSAGSATLSFDYHLDHDSPTYVVGVSADGGQTWTILKTYSDESLVFGESFDLTPYISPNTWIGFALTGGGSGHFYIDNVEITLVEGSGNGGGSQGSGNSLCPNCAPNTYLDTINVEPVWEMGLDGSGIGVAVIDSGIDANGDFTNLVASVTFGDAASEDIYGHGTHVAGILAGNGYSSGGWYRGVAPNANLISLAVSDQYGMSLESDVVAALQWVYDNRSTYNIRVVNMSFNSTEEQSYHASPMNAAAEILWFNGVVVVVSAGNSGRGDGPNTALAAPANDPFVITVGASHENGSNERDDDEMAGFSAHGQCAEGYAKPDIIAPGKNIVSVLSRYSHWDDDHPDRSEDDGDYFRLSGTSMATPMVSGAITLLLQDEPNLTPDQVKYRLTHAGSSIGNGGFAYLDVHSLVTTSTSESANTGQDASQLLWTGDQPVVWGSVAWNSVAWNSVAWNSVAWNSVAWNSVAWNSVSWED